MQRIETKDIGFLVALMLTCGLLLAASQPALAQGGCGSVCMPLEILGPEVKQLQQNQLRFFSTIQYAEYDSFRAGSQDIVNPGGNEAILKDITFFFDYGVTRRFTLLAMIPYVEKRQQTNRFGQRTADGVGDIALFGNYVVSGAKDVTAPTISVGLGVKFPTGDIEQPGGDQPRLPPAFQGGSGAYDLFPTISYHQAFRGYSLWGNSFLRLPLEDNKFGYEFGEEFEMHFGVTRPLRIWKGRLELLASLDYLRADQDTDSQETLPSRLRDGTKVINTGGEFLDLTPGVRFIVTPRLSIQVRAFLPVQEDWNGDSLIAVGQVAPDATYQFTFAFAAPLRGTGGD